MARKSSFLAFSLVVMAFIFLVQAQLAFAADPPAQCTKTGDVYTCSFNNPLTKSATLCNLINSVVGQVRPFAIILVEAAIIYLGFRYVVVAASGNTGKLKDIHKQLAWLLIAAAIIGGAVIIIGAVVKVFSTGPPAC